jgi:TRAP-type C4-dicarboxylate transport system substrate-binding protein
MRALALAALLLVAQSVRADESHVVIRIGTVVPEGTSWARELKAFTREIATATNGKVQVKLYLGGIAGDEMQAWDRIKRQQLDGAFSGGMLCERIAPSFRVMRIPGLFQSRDENAYVLGRLKPQLDKEFLEAGMVHLGSAGIGATIVFSRTPVTTLSDLRQLRLWVWDIDEVLKMFLPAMGLKLNPTPIAQAAQQYDSKAFDVFIAPASAALGYQWSAQVKYFTDLRVSYLSGCVFVASRVFDALPEEYKQVLRSATAKTQVRFEDAGRKMDDELLGGLFQKQGLQKVPVSTSLRSEFFDVARTVRERMVGNFIAAPLVDRVLGMLADFRGSR